MDKGWFSGAAACVLGLVGFACSPEIRSFGTAAGAGGDGRTSDASSAASSGTTGVTSSSSGVGGDDTGGDGTGGAGGACQAPEALVDQSLLECTSPPVTQCTTSWVISNGQSAAQSFTVGATGILTKIRLRISNEAYSTNTIHINLVKGGTDPSWLAQRSMGDVNANTIAEADVQGDKFVQWQDVVFGSPPEVEEGEVYVVVVTMGGPPAADDLMIRWAGYNYWQGDQVDSYPGGRAFTCGAGCPSFNEEPPYRDLEFETYVAPSMCL